MSQTVPATETALSTTLTGEPLFGMEIEDVLQQGSQILVQTTGATYMLRPDRLEMTRRIDPSTNTENPLLVARLVFDQPIGFFSIVEADRQECMILGSGIEFRFHADSMIFITPPEGKGPIGYRHEALIGNAPWMPGNTSSSEKMWSDGNGGSLHALATGTVLVTTTLGGPVPEITQFTLPPGSTMSHMVFPAKPFDFETLYGTDSRPLTAFVNSTAWAGVMVDDLDSDPSLVTDNHFGYVVGLIAQMVDDPRREWLLRHPELIDVEYQHLWRRAALPADEEERSQVVTDFYDAIERLYPDKTPPVGSGSYANPNASLYTLMTESEKVRLVGYIESLHQRGLKFLLGLGAYTVWLPPSHEDLLFTWLRDLKERLGFDGFYFDNGAFGPTSDGPWYATYRFFRRLRQELGDDLYIFHHNSVDVWGARTGALRAIMVDTWSNASLAGEVGAQVTVDDPHAAYFRNYTCGYGFSQTHAHHKRASGHRGAISEREKTRTVTDNLNGIERVAWARLRANNHPTQQEWAAFLERFNARRAAYQSDPAGFPKQVSWPAPWFESISDLTIAATDSQAVLTWTTSDATSCQIAYLPRLDADTPEPWWGGTGEAEVQGTVVDEADLTTNHQVTLTGLAPDTPYQVRIRCLNSDDKVWGVVDTFQTISAP